MNKEMNIDSEEFVPDDARLIENVGNYNMVKFMENRKLLNLNTTNTETRKLLDSIGLTPLLNKDGDVDNWNLNLLVDIYDQDGDDLYFCKDYGKNIISKFDNFINKNFTTINLMDVIYITFEIGYVTVFRCHLHTNVNNFITEEEVKKLNKVQLKTYLELLENYTEVLKICKFVKNFNST